MEAGYSKLDCSTCSKTWGCKVAWKGNSGDCLARLLLLLVSVIAETGDGPERAGL